MALFLAEAFLAGRVANEPELKQTPAGKAVVTFSVAVNKWKGQSAGTVGEFFEVVAWEKIAERVAKFFPKGSLIYVAGELEQQRWEDKNTGLSRSKIILRARDVKFAGDKTAEKAATNDNAGDDYGGASAYDSDLPF